MSTPFEPPETPETDALTPSGGAAPTATAAVPTAITAAGSINRLVLVGAAGANKVMAGELSRLVRRALDDVRLPEPEKDGPGAVYYPFDLRTAAVAALYHRTSSRVLWGLYQSPAARLEPLFDDLRGLISRETRPWLTDGASFSVTPATTQEFAAGGRQLVGVLKNALIEGAAARGLALRVDTETPDLSFMIRATDGVVSVALDLAGRAMNQRGYRTEGGGTAPLRESLAAMMVMLARHDARTEALLDPMAGSGTIAIEAACMARGRPVWVPPRAPACLSWPFFQDAARGLGRPLFGDTTPVVFANELERDAYAQSQGNYVRAGVDDEVERNCGDFRWLDAQRVTAHAASKGMERGLLLCNPPYGERLAPQELSGLYRELGAFCRRLRGWRAGFLVANADFEAAFARGYGGLPRVKKPLSNGALPAYFMLYDEGR